MVGNHLYNTRPFCKDPFGPHPDIIGGYDAGYLSVAGTEEGVGDGEEEGWRWGYEGVGEGRTTRTVTAGEGLEVTTTTAPPPSTATMADTVPLTGVRSPQKGAYVNNSPPPLAPPPPPPPTLTASLAQWLRRQPRERQIWVRSLISPWILYEVKSYQTETSVIQWLL